MPKVTQLLGTERGPERRSRDSLPSAHLRSVVCVQRFRSSRQWAFKSFGGKPGRRWQSLILAAPPPPQVHSRGEAGRGWGGRIRGKGHFGSPRGGRWPGAQPCPRGQAGRHWLPGTVPSERGLPAAWVCQERGRRGDPLRAALWKAVLQRDGGGGGGWE